MGLTLVVPLLPSLAHPPSRSRTAGPSHSPPRPPTGAAPPHYCTLISTVRSSRDAPPPPLHGQHHPCSLNHPLSLSPRRVIFSAVTSHLWCHLDRLHRHAGVANGGAGVVSTSIASSVCDASLLTSRGDAGGGAAASTPSEGRDTTSASTPASVAPSGRAVASGGGGGGAGGSAVRVPVTGRGGRDRDDIP